MAQLTKNALRFFKSFNNNFSQYELTKDQFIAFLNDDDDAVSSETYTALADAYNLWCDAIEGVSHVSN